MGNHTTRDYSVSEDLRSTILTDPRAAAEVVLNVELTDDIDVVVLEDTEDVRHIVLPGVMLENVELSDISGGGGLQQVISVLAQKGEQGLMNKTVVARMDGSKWTVGHSLLAGQEEGLSAAFRSVAEEAGAAGGRAGLYKGIALGVGSTVLAGASGVGVNAWLNS